mgnify:CR=1 FL=1
MNELKALLKTHPRPWCLRAWAGGFWYFLDAKGKEVNLALVNNLVDALLSEKEKNK